MAWADRFRSSTEVRRDPGSLVSAVGVTARPPVRGSFGRNHLIRSRITNVRHCPDRYSGPGQAGTGSTGVRRYPAPLLANPLARSAVIPCVATEVIGSLAKELRSIGESPENNYGPLLGYKGPMGFEGNP